MQSARSGAGLRYLSRWALLQERLLALICGHTMRGSSTHITFSRPETICLYVQSFVFFSLAEQQQQLDSLLTFERMFNGGIHRPLKQTICNFNRLSSFDQTEKKEEVVYDRVKYSMIIGYVYFFVKQHQRDTVIKDSEFVYFRLLVPPLSNQVLIIISRYFATEKALCRSQCNRHCKMSHFLLNAISALLRSNHNFYF